MVKSKKSAKKILPKLTASNYYDKSSDLAYMSVSQYKSFMSCEAGAMAKLNGEYEEEKSTALLVGSYCDSAIEGTLEQFKAENPQIFKKNGELYSDYAKAEEIVKLIRENELFQKYLVAGEKQVILTFELFGVWWKIKMDSFDRGKRITDMKIMRNTESIPKWRYDTQGTIYQKGVELNDLGKLPFYLAVATKEDIPDLNIFQIPQSTLDLALMEVEENLPHIMEVKLGNIPPTRCEKCDYCKKTRQVRIRNYNELLE